MKFFVQYREATAGCSPYRLVDEQGGEIEWANRFLDVQRVRGLQELSLRYYGHTLLHFVRWWDQQPGVDVRRFDANQFNEATLLDYVRAQRAEQRAPSAETINSRSAMLRRLFRFYLEDVMPHAPCLLQRRYWTAPGGRVRRRAPATDFRLRVPPRVIEPLSREQVQRFWSSFRTARDIAIVGLLLWNGLRSREVLALELEDLRMSEGQLRVNGKGGKVRLMPLPPETTRLLDCYLKTERPLTNDAHVFVSLKGKARGKAMTRAGLRRLFRYHRVISRVAKANPHRFRHNFGSDMIRAGVSLPALQRLMGHANIETTMLYIQISPQDVYEEYARAVARQTGPPRIAEP
ncbi:MAG: tyrosine-type recombinase/integrase [Acidobacteria bacterium]|nr:tyrosine-type recombinase/integrase [Acidobacteriota bacterium]